MSEKHLTELPWKVIVTKQGIKDIGLGKALVAYVNIERTKEPAKALEALREISELALKLKKANAGKETVVEHLDEVIKEVKKTISAVEVLVKSANAATATAEKAALPGKVEKEGDETEEEEEDEEFAALKKDLKKQMVSALAQVKARAPGEPGDGKEALPQLKFGAYLAAKTATVIISKKVGPATKKLLLEIAGGVSGGQYSIGECIFEKNAHTFVLDKIPGGLAKKLAQALFAETGAKYKVRARSTDGSTVLDSDTDTDAQFVPAPPPSPSQTPPSPTSTASGKEEDKGAGIYQRRIAAVE